jgi:hypothetical protein
MHAEMVDAISKNNAYVTLLMAKPFSFEIINVSSRNVTNNQSLPLPCLNCGEAFFPSPPATGLSDTLEIQ